MRTIRLSPAARRDLSEIWDYTQMRWNADQAEIYLRRIESAMELIAENPKLGRRRDEVRRGYRSYAIGSHLLFFLDSGEFLDVIRVLHQRMDHSEQMLSN